MTLIKPLFFVLVSLLPAKTIFASEQKSRDIKNILAIQRAKMEQYESQIASLEQLSANANKRLLLLEKRLPSSKSDNFEIPKDMQKASGDAKKAILSLTNSLKEDAISSYLSPLDLHLKHFEDDYTQMKRICRWIKSNDPFILQN